VRACQGFRGQHCGAPIPTCDRMCVRCGRLEAQWDAGVSLWVSQGLRELSEYLADWAAFSAWLELHGLPV
jgi:hypothetical protein